MMHRVSVVSCAADGRLHPLGVRGVGHDVEHLVGDPPHDDVVDHRAVAVVEEVGVLRPAGPDAAEIVGEGGLEAVQGVGALDPDRAQMAHVEDHRVLTAGPVLGQGALGIGERHLPSAEADQLGPQLAMGADESGVMEGHVERGSA